MKLSDLVKLTNEKLDGERLTELQLLSHFDSVISDINEALSAVYPTFSEAKALPGYDGTYTLLPDNYLRSIVPLGAALKYYQIEEEGEGIARSYEAEYSMALFVIKRDYLTQVPEIFQAITRGYYDMSSWNGSGYQSSEETYFPGISSVDMTVVRADIAKLKADYAALLARVEALEAE